MSIVFADAVVAIGYNTLIVMAGATILGIGAGSIGVWVLLVRRAMISDAISHATLPGIGVGFLIAWTFQLDGGRHLPLLMIGAAIAGWLAVVAVQWIRDHTRLPVDTAIGSVLSCSFGIGVVILSHIQTLRGSGQAGLNSFLLGSITALNADEAQIILISALVVIVLVWILQRPLGSVCFDPLYIHSLGWSVRRIEMIGMILLLIVLCVGLKTIGLVLMIALLIIPPVSARLWTSKLPVMMILSAMIGGIACGVAC